MKRSGAEWRGDEMRRRMMLKIPAALDRAGIVIEGQAIALCPVDEGNLRGSINHRVRENEVHVGASAEYAPHVEFGTRPHIITVKDAKALSDGKQIFGKSVKHPGTKKQPFLRPALTKAREQAVKVFRETLGDAL